MRLAAKPHRVSIYEQEIGIDMSTRYDIHSDQLAEKFIMP
jgi:hypothetical protein